jgi:hypothetical protein
MRTRPDPPPAAHRRVAAVASPGRPVRAHGTAPAPARKARPEQSSLTRAAFHRHQEQAKRTPGPPWIANEDSSSQVSELDRAICVVTGHGRLHLGCTYADYLIHVLSQRAWSRAHGLVVRVTPNLPHEPWTEGTARLAARTRIRRWPIDRTAGARRSGPLDRGKTSAAAAAITRASGQRGPPRACSSRLLRVSPHRVPLSRPAAQAGPPASGWARVVSAAGGNAGLRPVLLLFSTASPGLAPWHGR